MEKLMEQFEEARAIVEKVSQMPTEVALSLMCMVIDQVAKMADMTSVELIDDVKPIIAAVNEEMGDMGLM